MGRTENKKNITKITVTRKWVSIPTCVTIFYTFISNQHAKFFTCMYISQQWKIHLLMKRWKKCREKKYVRLKCLRSNINLVWHWMITCIFGYFYFKNIGFRRRLVEKIKNILVLNCLYRSYIYLKYFTRLFFSKKYGKYFHKLKCIFGMNIDRTWINIRTTFRKYEWHTDCTYHDMNRHQIALIMLNFYGTNSCDEE